MRAVCSYQQATLGNMTFRPVPSWRFAPLSRESIGGQAMRQRARALIAVSVLVSMPLMGGAHAQASADVLTRSTVTAEQRMLSLASLWSEARFSFAYYDKVAAGWDSLYQAFIPRIRAAASDYEYYLELMRFFAHLRDGHSGIFWPPAFDEALGYPPLEIRKIQGRAVIFRILRDTDELTRNEIRPGLAIIRIDGKPVEDQVAYWRALKTGSTEQATDRLAYFRILTGRRNSQVEFVVEEPGGARRMVRLSRSEKYFNDTNLQPPRLYSSRAPESGIGYFQANQMTDSVGEAFGRYIETAGALEGLILDLRYNGGGSDLVSYKLVSRLIDEPLDGQIYEVLSYRPDHRAYRREQETIRTRGGKIAPAVGKRFTGKLVVLIGEQTHSAAEGGFLSVVRNRPRTVFIGEPTAGSTGQPMGFRLAGGALGVVCSVRTLAPDGRPFVGVGFQPDVKVSLTQDDLFRRRDGVLDRSIEELKRGERDR